MSDPQGHRFKPGDLLIFKYTDIKYKVIEISKRGYELLVIHSGRYGWDSFENEHNYKLDEESIVTEVLSKYGYENN